MLSVRQSHKVFRTSYVDKFLIFIFDQTMELIYKLENFYKTRSRVIFKDDLNRPPIGMIFQ
jgi:hypothetical protein